MSASEHRETERKYDVPLEAVVPSLVSAPGVARVAPPVEVEQVATYYDTEDLRLLAAGITLRNRSGGVDDGWHLKLPATHGSRLELRVPPDQRKSPPFELLERVRVHVRDAELSPRAVLTSRRTIHRLLADHSGVLAELCDDRVHAVVNGDPAATDTWREWELELVEGAESLMEGAEPLLFAAGARPSASSSKAARVLGEAPSVLPPWRSRAQLSDNPSAGDLLCAYLAQHLQRLQEQDMLLRTGDQEGVHQLRIAARRIRSALATYAPVLQPGSTERLREDLRWLGGTLSEARDAQVLQSRLDQMVTQQPAELVLGPVRRRIDDELRTAFRRGRSHADEQLGGTRYFRLLDNLESFVADPPLTAAALRPTRQEVARLIAADARRVRKRDRAYRSARDEHARNLSLHDVRKAAKRLRYAAETTRPVFGKRASKLAARARAVQELLGEHQDAVVAREALRDIAVRAHLAGENGFTFGRLHALEEARAATLESAYPAVKAELRVTKVRAWLLR